MRKGDWRERNWRKGRFGQYWDVGSEGGVERGRMDGEKLENDRGKLDREGKRKG